MRFPRVEGQVIASVLWRRVDEHGLEYCRLWQTTDGFVLEGRVLNSVDGSPAEVRYAVHCDAQWRTRSAQVRLTAGRSMRVVELARDERGSWSRDGTKVDGFDGVVDADLGFTPATNTLPIRRLNLEVGASADVDAAWLRFPDLELQRLSQRYTRTDASRYRYESAGGAFTADLEVDRQGLVVRYGELWERVSAFVE